MNVRPLAAALAFSLALPALAGAAGLDISSEYRMRALNYRNLDLNPQNPQNRSLLSQSARLGFMLKNIALTEAAGGNGASMDIGLKLRALGVAGSTTAFHPPFDRIAANYPNTSFIPFFENAYLDVHAPGGGPWDVRLGQQSYRLGSGLLFDDNGAGVAGVSAQASLPWWGLRTQGFVFQSRNRQTGANNLDVYGLSLELPTDGTWQLNQLFENDRAPQTVNVTGCPGGCASERARRYFTSLRYQLNYGPVVFDGEAAVQTGSALTSGPTSIGRVSYFGNAQLVRAKWKQTFYKDIRGIARLSFSRGSGDNSSTPNKDEAFFPSSGLRFDGLEPYGMGDFFAATPYSAFGGRSTTTATGLPVGVSGVVTVGIGVTPPAYRGFILDIDYFLYQADRNTGPHRNLGSETDFRLRYDFGDRLGLRATAAFFKAGVAANPTKGNSQRYMLEAIGRF